MDFETAKHKVEAHINKKWIEGGHAIAHGPLIIVEHIDKSYGWVFFYTAQMYWETRDIKHAIAGNGPIIVDQRTGALHQLGTATPPEDQIRQWELANGQEI
jgi:hypothetical protein